MPDGRKLPAQSENESGAKTVNDNLHSTKEQATNIYCGEWDSNVTHSFSLRLALESL